MHTEKKKKMTTIRVSMSTIQHASDLASVYHAGDEPEPSGKKKTPGLYGSDLKTLMYSDAACIPMLFTDERILVSLESVLQFLFSTAQRLEWSNRRVHQANLRYKDSIIETFSLPSSPSPRAKLAAKGKRHDACMVNLKRSMLLSVVSGSILALRGIEMDKKKQSKVCHPSHIPSIIQNIIPNIIPNIILTAIHSGTPVCHSRRGITESARDYAGWVEEWGSEQHGYHGARQGSQNDGGCMGSVLVLHR